MVRGVIAHVDLAMRAAATAGSAPGHKPSENLRSSALEGSSYHRASPWSSTKLLQQQHQLGGVVVVERCVLGESGVARAVKDGE